MEYVIVGNGIAGTCAAEAIREVDPEGSIRMVGDENTLPYSRPMISMVLAGSVPPEKLSIRSENFYDHLQIDPVLGSRISTIDVDNRRVLMENSSQFFSFDKLLIATGADAKPVDADGRDLGNIFYMRTKGHVLQMLDVLPQTRNPLVLGGGLVGFKAAYGLLKRGLKPTMLITSGYPLSMQLDETAGLMVLDELLEHGLNVRVGISVKSFEGNGTVKKVLLSDGTALVCDLVIAGKGVSPALSFLPENVPVNAGIMVNQHMETGAAGIFAAGDVAESVDIVRKIPWINAIWPEAAEQGRIAGMNMAGLPVAYRGTLSRNVMRIFGLDLMTLGVVNPEASSGHEIFTKNDHRRKTYRKLVFREEVLVGAILINQMEQGGLFLSLIRNEIPITIPRENLLDPGFNFRQLMRE
ncbi:MAG TPA: NAD(P)/FAD-dependent oxidoreductase [Deltaproteobacteria bacterium]|nr:NAD(P)/FAD-dependent oxidoreductase [Deltaproteobacteria bacterium]